jgi:hypothetical protein
VVSRQRTHLGHINGRNVNVVDQSVAERNQAPTSSRRNRCGSSQHLNHIVEGVHRETNSNGNVSQDRIAQDATRMLDGKDKMYSERATTPSNVREYIVGLGKLAQKLMHLIHDDG